MYKRTFIVPIVVSIFCGFILISYQNHSDASTYALTSPVQTVDLTNTASDIIDVQYKWGDGSITASRENNNWVITSPIKASGDSSYIYTIISNFTAPGNLHLTASNVDNPSEYGIDLYSPSVIFHASNGTTYHLIKGNALDDVYDYAYNPSTKMLYAVSKDLFAHLSKDTTTWYNKDFIGFKEDAIDTITLNLNGTSHVITPTFLHNQTSFSSSTLTTDVVNSVINFLSTTKATSYVVDNASTQVIESYGFNDSPITLTIKQKDGTLKTFLISTSSSTSDSQYVLIKDNNTIITISNLNLVLPPK